MQEQRLQTQDSVRSVGRGPSMDISRKGGTVKSGGKALDETPEDGAVPLRGRGWLDSSTAEGFSSSLGQTAGALDVEAGSPRQHASGTTCRRLLRLLSCRVRSTPAHAAMEHV